MSTATRSCLTLLAFALLTITGRVSAGTVDDFHPKELIDGPKKLDEVTVNGYYAASQHWGKGILFWPTGNGYAGRLYQTANKAPAAILSNNRNPCTDADPILSATGTKVETYPLFELPGEMGLRYILYYNGGRGWRDNLGYYLDTNCSVNPPDIGRCKTTTLYRPDGSTIVYVGGPIDTVYIGGGANKLTRDAATGIYTLQDEDTTTQTYTSAGVLQSITDVSGIRWTLNSDGNGTTTVTHTSGRSFSVKYGDSRTTITDPAGNVYTLQGLPLLGSVVSSITFPGTPATVIGFKYLSFDSPPYGYGLSEVDYNGTPYSYTTYDTNAKVPNTSLPNRFYRRATGSYLADGSENVNIAYGADGAGNLQATVTNPLGHSSVKTFDIDGNVTQISNAAVQTCGATISGSTYDANGYLSAEIDNNGNTHAYTYAGNGQLQTETEAYGTPIARTTAYVWDPNVALNRLLSVTVQGWRKTVYSYDARNRLASTSVTNLSTAGTANETLTTTYGYSLYGNGMVQAMTVTRPTGNADTYAYDTRGNLTSVTDAKGFATVYSNYNGLGQAGHVVGPNGDATDYSYDARGHIVSKTTYPGGIAAVWTYAYDGFGLLSTLNAPTGEITTWHRDPSTMRVTSITRNDKDGDSTEYFAYDANGDVLEHSVIRGSTFGLDEIYHYDAQGRLYQKAGQNGQLLAYTYDGNGNTLSVTNALGHRVSYAYDALNRVSAKTEDDVPVPPPVPASAPTLSAPANSSDGNYTVSWNSINQASAYTLQMQFNGGAWSTLQNGSTLNWSASGQNNGTYGYQVQACNVSGCSPWSAMATTTVVNTNPQQNPIGIDGRTYEAYGTVKSGSNSMGVGFDITGGTTWEVFKSVPTNNHVVMGSGPVPAGAVSVQYTWIDAGVPDGVPDAKGSINNPAASPVALSASPTTLYTTAPINANQGTHAHRYQLRVDFFDANGTNISTSTCLLIAELEGNQ